MNRVALWALAISAGAAASGNASAATGAETIVLDVSDYGVVQLPLLHAL